MILDSIFNALMYIAKLIPFVIIGLFLAELIMALGLVEKLSWLTRPLTDFGRLNRSCGLSFLTAFVSPTAGNSMLLALYREGKINSKGVILTALANSFPAGLMPWRWMLPVVLSVLGMTGLLYFGITVVAGFMKLLVVLIAGRAILPKGNNFLHEPKQTTKKTTLKEAIPVSLRNTKKMGIRILEIIVPVTVLVFVLLDLGMLKILTSYLEKFAKVLPIPAEGVPIIVSQLASNIAGFTVAGNLLAKGVITANKLILCLLVGNILSFTITTFRILIPFNIGIFGRGLGLKIVLLKYGLYTGVNILVLITLAIFWR
ncbi:MAG: hypothetical protein DRP76_00825 [Candidatus Omnitrophota bacterium]|nr:MAG: hypothetical protein DRP61_03965 [Candidatus Omnitrophota bacterium]RKY40972.1 MAG: hypothetical protein DRP76_00825 [Candidatus Omnitrophota bacterium]